MNSEADFIKERVLVKKEQLSQGGLEVPEDKELIKEAIGEKIEESLKNYPPAVELHKTSPAFSSPAPPVLAEDEDTKQKLNELVQIALNESIPKAVTTALKTSNAYLIDKLHDTLVDKYYEVLKQQKLI